MKMHKHLNLRVGQFLARTFKKHLLSELVLHFFTTHLQTDRQKPYQIRFAHVLFIKYVIFVLQNHYIVKIADDCAAIWVKFQEPFLERRSRFNFRSRCWSGDLG